MKCNRCGGDMASPETRNLEYSTYRKKKCLSCGNIYYTKEVLCDAEEAKDIFRQWNFERGKKHRLKEKGIEWSPEQSSTPKKHTQPLF